MTIPDVVWNRCAGSACLSVEDSISMARFLRRTVDTQSALEGCSLIVLVD